MRDDSGSQATGRAGEKVKFVRPTVHFEEGSVWRPSSFLIGSSGLVQAYDNEREGLLVPLPRLGMIIAPLPEARTRT